MQGNYKLHLKKIELAKRHTMFIRQQDWSNKKIDISQTNITAVSVTTNTAKA